MELVVRREHEFCGIKGFKYEVETLATLEEALPIMRPWVLRVMSQCILCNKVNFMQ